MCPNLRSLWPTVSESFAETFHAPLQSFVWSSLPILVSRTVKTGKFKLPYFRNGTCFGAGNLYLLFSKQSICKAAL